MRTPWMASCYTKRDDLHWLIREIEGQKFYVLIRAETGARVVFDEEGHSRCLNDELNEIEIFP